LRNLDWLSPQVRAVQFQQIESAEEGFVDGASRQMARPAPMEFQHGKLRCRIGHAAVVGARSQTKEGAMRARASIAITLGVTLTAILVNSNVMAQQAPALAPPYKVTPLLKGPVTGDPNKETVMIRVEWPPNVSTGRHTHPGDEYGTVLEGTLISQDEGGEWKTYNAGESYHKVTGVVHETKSGDQPAKSLNVFVVEKGKPMVQPTSK
jgi:quercetin dioxygenase-like cupin family protein